MPADTEDERDRTEVTEITVYSKDAPDPGGFGEAVVFEGLTMSPGYVNKRTGQLSTPRWAATGIRKVGARPAPTELSSNGHGKPAERVPVPS